MITEWHEHEIAPSLRETSGVDAIKVMIEGIRKSVQVDPGAMRALYTLMFEALKPEPAILSQRMREVHRAQRRNLEEAVARGIALGTVRPDVSPAAAVQIVVSTLRGAAYQWLLEPAFDFDGTLAALEDSLEYSVRPHKATAT